MAKRLETTFWDYMSYLVEKINKVQSFFFQGHNWLSEVFDVFQAFILRLVKHVCDRTLEVLLG